MGKGHREKIQTSIPGNLYTFGRSLTGHISHLPTAVTRHQSWVLEIDWLTCRNPMRHEIMESQSEPPESFRSLDGRSLGPRLSGLVSFPHYPFMVIMIGDHCSVFILFCMHIHSVSYLTFQEPHTSFLDHCDLDCFSTTFLSSSLPSIAR